MSYYETERDKAIIASLKEIGSQLKQINEAISKEQREGEWTKHLDEWDCEYAKCSCCGEEFYDASGEDTIDMFYKFCPNCGAKMKGGAE